MFSEANLFDGYWREDISTTVYILNRGQLRVHSKKTPYELWYGRTPLVKYFSIFGSKCYIKNFDKDLGKFDARSDEGIFLGYASNKKAYRCYNLRLHKIVESADVKIDDLKTQKSNIKRAHLTLKVKWLKNLSVYRLRKKILKRMTRKLITVIRALLIPLKMRNFRR